MRTLSVLLCLSLAFPAFHLRAEVDPFEKWAQEAVDEATIQRAAEGHEIYLRLVSIGSWGADNAIYEIFSDNTVREIKDHDYIKSPLKVVFSRSDYKIPKTIQSKLDALMFLFMLERLERNDLFSLPRFQTLAIKAPLHFEDRYSIMLFVKVGPQTTYVRRTSWHDVLRTFHDELRKNWANQALEPTSTAVTPPAVAGDRASGTRGSP